MTTSDYTVGPGRPPLHSRFQKGQSGNPGGRPGPEKQLKQRFHRALREALEKNAQALEASRPTDMFASFARQLALDAVAGRGAAPRLLLTILEHDSGEKQDLVDRLFEAEHGVAPSFEEGTKAASAADALTALFSLSEGESQGENRKRMQEILKILDEIAPEPKEQGESRDIDEGADVAGII
jgi:thioredoxin-like negative regulator of GroEL